MVIGGWEVEEVLDCRQRHKKLGYNVKWIGEEGATWQPAADLANAADVVLLFHQRYPSRPGP